MSDTKRMDGQFVLLVTGGPKEPSVRMYGTRSRQNIALNIMPGLYRPAVQGKEARVESLLSRPLRLEMGLGAVEVLAEAPESTLCRFTLQAQRPLDFGVLLPESAPYEGRIIKLTYGMELYAVYSYYHGAGDTSSRVNAGELAINPQKFYLPSPIEDLQRVYDYGNKGYYNLIRYAAS